MMVPPIALVTDFGLADWYVGVMKAVILSVNPEVSLIDVTHSVPPQDVLAADFAVLASYAYLPQGSVVVVVVDPGVGGERRVLCAVSEGRSYVFPDNGVLTGLLDRAGFDSLVKVENSEYFLEPVSSTFHGRDIFAPVAAHLSLGVEPERLGPMVSDYVRLDIPRPELRGDRAITRIRWVDGFGNLITDCQDIVLDELCGTRGDLSIDLGPKGEIPVVSTYQSVEPNHPAAMIGSSGCLEISIREGSAARALGLTIGDTVTLKKR
jgi:S-adenosylmethionine hydrolase